MVGNIDGTVAYLFNNHFLISLDYFKHKDVWQAERLVTLLILYCFCTILLHCDTSASFNCLYLRGTTTASVEHLGPPQANHNLAYLFIYDFSMPSMKEIRAQK